MAKKKALDAIDHLIERYPVLRAMKEPLWAAAETIIECYRNGGKLLVCGNGGSAADAEHITGELMKGFLLPRRLGEEKRQKLMEACPEDAEYLIENLQEALPAISLVNQIALGTAFANDQSPDLVFAQQVFGLGKEGDVLLAISTSGNSANVLYAAQVARTFGISVIALTGMGGGRLRALADILLAVPNKETYRIQELHLPIYHALCIAAEEEFFGSDAQKNADESCPSREGQAME